MSLATTTSVMMTLAMMKWATKIKNEIGDLEIVATLLQHSTQTILLSLKRATGIREDVSILYGMAIDLIE